MSNALSDYNRTGQKASTVARKYLYADLPTSFTLHPILMDIRPVTDLDAVKNAVRNLVMTNHFERPFQPQIGGNIHRLLFEPVNIFTAISLQQEIESTLGKHEPRITDVSVQDYDDADNNRYSITIAYRVTFKEETSDTVSFFLSRLR